MHGYGETLRDNNRAYMEHNKDELIISLTVEYPKCEEVEVKIANPNKSIRATIDKMIDVFQLPKTDRFGSQIPYVLGIYEEFEEHIVLDFEDESGNAQSLLDYDIQSGDHLVLFAVPYMG